jgi:hypothetical protein
MQSFENYVLKKEVDWSLLNAGLTVPISNQVIFGRTMGTFLKRGETKDIVLILDGVSYQVKLTNENLAQRHNRSNDILQIRYGRNSDIAYALRAYFSTSYTYIVSKRDMRSPADRSMIRLPEDKKEYLAIYTTEYTDTYLLEAIVSEDIYTFNNYVARQDEQAFEASINYEVVDDDATVIETVQMNKLRKLNRKIGDNLKLLYDYRCQICGKKIGSEYDSTVAEAHHIDYFIKSLNNDADNQLIVCPNHHRIIHDVNPIFDKKKLLYVYLNGVQERLSLNRHL